MADKTLGDKIKTWIPLVLVACSVIASSAVGAYKLDDLKLSVSNLGSSKVSKETYELQLADVKSNQGDIKQDIKTIKALQQQQNDVRIRQEYITKEVQETKQDIEKLNKEMDENFSEIKGMLRRQLK